jgi:hypothetical protein
MPRSLPTSCVCLELRPLPSTGVTPASAVLRASPPPASAQTFPRGRLVGRPRRRQWASRVARAFLVCMLLPLPRHSDGRYFFAHSRQPCQPSPIWQSGRPAHRPFRGLLGIYSRYGLRTRAATVIRDTLIRRLQPFRLLHSCSGCFRLERVAGWGFHPPEERRLSTAHARSSPSSPPRNSLERGHSKVPQDD